MRPEHSTSAPRLLSREVVEGRTGRASRACAFLLGVAALIGADVVHAQDLSRPLSAQERTQLGAGELVARETVERRGRLQLIGGTSYQVIDRPVEEVWQTLTGPSADYRHMLPQVRRARELQRNGNERLIQFTHRVGPVRIGYALRFDFQPERKVIVFRLDEDQPHDIRAAWGFVRVRRWGQNKTLISFGAMVDIGTGVLSSAVLPTVHEWVLKIPWTIRRHVE